MHYLTRHLEALRDFPFGDALIPVGGRFHASEIDAEYLIRSKRALLVADPAVPVPAPQPVRQEPPTPAADIRIPNEFEGEQLQADMSDATPAAEMPAAADAAEVAAPAAQPPAAAPAKRAYTRRTPATAPAAEGE